MFKRVWMLAVVGVVVATARVKAEDAYFHVMINNLQLTEGELPESKEPDWSVWWRNRNRLAYAVLDGDGEVYVKYLVRPSGRRQDDLERDMVVRVPAKRDVTGRLYLPRSDDSGMKMVKFRIPQDQAQGDARHDFYEMKLQHYEDLLARGVPGAAWFRHEMRSAEQALRGTDHDTATRRGASVRGRRTDDLEETYALFTGGRAMSENLQLDRVLQTTAQGEETVPLDSIDGITIRHIDWKPLLGRAAVELDPLAGKIPADQHVVLFPSFNAAVAMADEMAADGAPILQMAEPRSSNALTFQRYQRQMCLTITDLARLLGPKVARSVAITGSDPYFRTGTDVAVLFESPHPAVLENLLMAQIRLAVAGDSSARPIQGEVAGLAYHGVLSDDRGICCYVAQSDGVVLVTNSLYQLEQFMKVSGGEAPSLASLDEYRFFRQRYRRGDDGETAFLFLSDATIRRWCGPRWRIATSRRTRDAAVIAQLQASQLDRLVQGDVAPGPLYTNLPLAEEGQLSLTADGVHSSAVGSLAFMTPISEMQFDRVTKAESDAYQRWRQSYQRNWQWAFDPIGVRLQVEPHRLAGDLTVMPMILRSRYRTLASYSQGASFAPDAGDLHDALAQVIMSVNTESEALQRRRACFGW